MKHYIFLLLLLQSNLIISQGINIRPFENKAYELNIKTIDFVVLDINFDMGFVAFKHVYEILGYNDMVSAGILDAPVNCDYSGMEKNPFAGVILGVYDLNKQNHDKVFYIYKSVNKKEDCMSYKESKSNLKEAKDYFLSKKLTIENKPKSLPFIHKYSNNTLILMPENITVKGNSERFFIENDNTNCVAKAILSVNNNIIYTIHQRDYPAMASSGDVLFISAYKNKNKIVFLERFHHYNNSDGRDSEFFHFTRIFDLSDLK